MQRHNAVVSIPILHSPGLLRLLRSQHLPASHSLTWTSMDSGKPHTDAEQSESFVYHHVVKWHHYSMADTHAILAKLIEAGFSADVRYGSRIEHGSTATFQGMAGVL